MGKDWGWLGDILNKWYDLKKNPRRQNKMDERNDKQLFANSERPIREGVRRNSPATACKSWAVPGTFLQRLSIAAKLESETCCHYTGTLFHLSSPLLLEDSGQGTEVYMAGSLRLLGSSAQPQRVCKTGFPGRKGDQEEARCERPRSATILGHVE